MDPNHDANLAQYTNDVPLPQDHARPVRLFIPGYGGGRCVEWLKKIWVNDKENGLYFCIWDNRFPPTFMSPDRTRHRTIVP